MKTLILATNDSSAGRLKASKAADMAIALGHRLLEGPLPDHEQQTAFFGSIQLTHEPQDDINHWLSWIGLAEGRRFGTFRPSLIETCRAYDRTEIWIDPDPNSYLILFQLIEALKSQPDILDRLSLAFPTRSIGELSPAEFEKTRAPLQPLTSEQLHLASRAWHAHQSRTPEAWFSLLNQAPIGMPGMRALVLSILAELPGATNGLSASEAQLLGLISSDGANHSTVLGSYIALRPRPTLDYWEAGRRIVSFSACNPPIICGVGKNSFSLGLHDDKARFTAYLKRRWSLSALGQRIIKGRDDLCEHVSVDRWLGNIHLTPDRLWRWDATNETLVEPN